VAFWRPSAMNLAAISLAVASALSTRSLEQGWRSW